MPRSQPDSSSLEDSSDESSDVPSFDDDMDRGHDDDTGADRAQPVDQLRLLEQRQAAERRSADAERARRQTAYNNLLARVACKGLAELCFHYLARHYSNTLFDRRTASARLQGQRRRMQHMEPGDIHATIMPQLDDALAAKLDRDYQSLGSMCDRGIPINDENWLDQVGRTTWKPLLLTSSRRSWWTKLAISVIIRGPLVAGRAWTAGAPAMVPRLLTIK